MSECKISLENLSEYKVDEKYGFLVPEPLVDLPEYFQPWTDFGKTAADLAQRKQLRDEIEKLPLLDDSRLEGYKEFSLALNCLCTMASCYVWQNGDYEVPKKIPKSLAVPLYNVSRRLGLQPIWCYQSGALSNWIRKDPNRQIELDNLEQLMPTPGGRDGNIFLLVTVQVEADFAKAIKPLLLSLQYSSEQNVERLIEQLVSITEVVKNMKHSMHRLHEINPSVFYNNVRPYMKGWDKSNHVLPSIVYEGVSESPIECLGGSAAQSPSLQSLDVLLGIRHEDEKQQYLDDIRSYMYKGHRKFIEDIQRASTVREFVVGSCSNELKEAYNNCTKAVSDFRSYHLQIVTRYILIPSRDGRDSDTSTRPDLTGTGGTDLMAFLKGTRSSTMDHVI